VRAHLKAWRFGHVVVTVFVLIVGATAVFVETAAAQDRARDLATANPAEVGVSADRLARLDAGMRRVVDDGTLAGVVMMLARHGKVVFADSAGTLDIGTAQPVQLDSIFRIFSLTKPVVGVAMMMLEEGAWQLRDPVSRHIPAFAHLMVHTGVDAAGNSQLDAVDPARPMTIRDLMTHTAGLGYVFNQAHPVNRAFVESGVLDTQAPLQTMIDKLAKIPLLAQPGTEWVYSAAVDVQGYLVEQLSGQPLGDFLEERIFAPLGMVDTAFYVPADKLHRLATRHGHDVDGALTAPDGGPAPTSPPLGPSGGGGLYGTAPDYLRFAQMLLNGGELNGARLLAPRSIALMSRDHLNARERATHFFPGEGFGLDFSVVIDDAASGQSWSTGSYYWFGAAGTWFWVDPVQDLTFVGMVQVDPAAYNRVHQLSRSLVYQAIVAK
jgi:CubicO group peptidase (beta-lactamase class C family)